MQNAAKFREKLHKEKIPLGTGVSFTDPTVTELFSQSHLKILPLVIIARSEHPSIKLSRISKCKI